MADLLKRGSDWLQKTRAAYAAQDVSYVRGASSVSVRAAVGRSTFEIDEGGGLTTQSRTRDYLILASDLSLDDVPVTPEPGDRVVEAADGTDGVAYEVMAVGNEPCWRWSDVYRAAYRIHTRYVGEQPLAT